MWIRSRTQKQNKYLFKKLKLLKLKNETIKMIEKKYFRGIRLFCRILHILDLSWLALHSTFKLIALFPTLSVSFRLLQEKQNSLEKEREISSVLFLRPFNRLDWIPLTTSSVILFTQPVHSEGDQPWDFFGKNDAKD